MAETETTDGSSGGNAAEPKAFGRYQLLERIGAGGMAEVFKARIDAAAGTEKFVCIKRILPRLSRSGDFTSLFVSEARVTLPLTHSNITQVFDFGEVDETYFLAMEYVRGQNLARVLEQLAHADAPLNVAAALFIAAELCRGLQYAHGQTDSAGKPAPVVHRDVTPHNVLLSYHGEVKLTDFGIALAATKAPEGEQVLRGKPCYVSPEQAAGKSGDPRSDLFSVGAVLYEMLSGIRLFEGENDADTLTKVQTLEVSPPSEHNPQVDADLDRAVLKALSRDPDDRYQRAGDLQVELSQMLHKRETAFTAVELSKLMEDLFAWEIEAERGNGGPRDRLLFQLSRAGVQLDGKGASTDELLQMGTVAISAEGGRPSPAGGRDGRIWPWIGVGVLLLLGAITGAVFALREAPVTAPAVPDAVAGPATAPPHELTEHLIPRSLRVPEGAGAEQAVAEQPGAATGLVTTKAPPAPGPPAKGRARRSAPAIRAADDGEAARSGYFNCNSWPWSLVYLDGKRLRGNTPLYGVQVHAGRHQLRFVNPELGLSREVAVAVLPGQTKTIAVKLQPAGAAHHESSPTDNVN